jgi:hypothetical protein
MRQGFVKITPELITEALNFPVGWKIENMTFDQRENIIVALISGADFPESSGCNIKDCHIICHKEAIRFEVEEIKK